MSALVRAWPDVSTLDPCSLGHVDYALGLLVRVGRRIVADVYLHRTGERGRQSSVVRRE